MSSCKAAKGSSVTGLEQRLGLSLAGKGSCPLSECAGAGETALALRVEGRTAWAEDRTACAEEPDGCAEGTAADAEALPEELEDRSG